MSEKKKFLIFLVKNAFLNKKYKFLEFLKISILSLGYQTICDEMFLEISVRENAYPLGQPTWFCVKAIFRGACVQTHVLKK